ncbi:hypothetical protein IBTHAUMO2_1050012 [Nitrosopumilaceae archaeon]|nr:hypothetical protein IBTHAUMO2_1050012 [Nitrosopumilaceae archaeon]
MDPEADRIDRIVRSLMHDLEENGWFREAPVISRKAERIFTRLCLTNFTFLNISITRDNAAKYKTLMADTFPRLSESDWEEMTSCMIFYHIIQSYEFVAKIFVEVLDPARLGMTRPPVISDILKRLDKTIECGEFASLMNNRLRNALAHGDYWIERDPSGRRLVYDGAPDGGLTMRDLVAESRIIREVIAALVVWCRNRLHASFLPDPARDPS